MKVKMVAIFYVMKKETHVMLKKTIAEKCSNITFLCIFSKYPMVYQLNEVKMFYFNSTYSNVKIQRFHFSKRSQL